MCLQPLTKPDVSWYADLLPDSDEDEDLMILHSLMKMVLEDLSFLGPMYDDETARKVNIYPDSSNSSKDCCINAPLMVVKISFFSHHFDESLCCSMIGVRGSYQPQNQRTLRIGVSMLHLPI